MATGTAHQNLNVFKKPLLPFSTDPMTGYYRDGYCRVKDGNKGDDPGNHSIAATLTDPFLDFTVSRGNNLRSIGLKAGCKWCLCASRWREALDHAKSQEKGGQNIVPQVHLYATDKKALEVVDIGDLKKYAAAGEAAQDAPRNRNTEISREKTELATKDEMTSRVDEHNN